VVALATLVWVAAPVLPGPALQGVAERRPQGSVYVVGGSRREASGVHFAVELLDVLGFEPGDAVGPIPGTRCRVTSVR
jgi:hypothetical protein